jgi:hypothetical protein
MSVTSVHININQFTPYFYQGKIKIMRDYHNLFPVHPNYDFQQHIGNPKSHKKLLFLQSTQIF